MPDKVVSIIWEKDRWSWGLVYKALHSQMSEFLWEAIAFEPYKENNETVPVADAKIIFCQNVTQMCRVPQHRSCDCIVRLGGIMNFVGNSQKAINAYKQIMSKCGAIITTNHQLYEIAKQMNDNVFLIPNGLDLEAWHPLPNKVWRIHRPVVGFVGNIKTKAKRDYKGFDFVQRNCERMQLPLKLALYQNSQIPHNEMMERFYHQIDILVHPTAGEGSSNTIMEALACGIPVITTHLAGYHGETMMDGENVVFCERSMSSVAKAIGKFRENRALFERISANSRLFAEEHHDIRKVVEEYRKVFAIILKK